MTFGDNGFGYYYFVMLAITYWIGFDGWPGWFGWDGLLELLSPGWFGLVELLPGLFWFGS